MLSKKKKKTEINLHKKKKKTPRKTSGILYTALVKERVAIVAILSASICFLLVVYQSMFLYKAMQLQKSAHAEKQKVVNQIQFWNQAVSLRPDYRDGYFMLALLHHRMGEYDLSLERVKKTLIIDPNFSQGKQMEKLLEEK